MIETPRLTLVPLSLDQLRLHVENSTRLEESLGLLPGHREVVEPLLSVITYFTLSRLNDPDLDPLYHTVWIAIDRQTRQIVADAKLKGEPDETGTVEIGYGTYPAFQRRGYMTEVVGGLVDWVSRQPDVRRIMADTDEDNMASQRVLQKNGFLFVEQLDGLIWWERKTVNELHFNHLGFLTPNEAITVSRQTMAHYFGRSSIHRKKLWQECISFLDTIYKEGMPYEMIWVDGSFVTRADSPNDIDIVVFVPKSYLENEFSSLDRTSQFFPQLDIKWVPLYGAATTLSKAIDELEEMKWFALFSTSRNGHRKGFLRLMGK